MGCLQEKTTHRKIAKFLGLLPPFQIVPLHPPRVTMLAGNLGPRIRRIAQEVINSLT